MEDNPRQFLQMDEYELDEILMKIKDVNLRFSLQFGIGLHHAGLVDQDRKIVEALFLDRKIQVSSSFFNFLKSSTQQNSHFSPLFFVSRCLLQPAPWLGESTPQPILSL